MESDIASLRTEISALLTRRDFEGLKRKLKAWLPIDIAPHLADLPVNQLGVLFRGCSKELGVAVFSYLDQETKRNVLRALPQTLVASLLNELPPDDRALFLEDLPLDLAMQLLSLLSPEERKITQELLAYPEDSVGRMMTLDYVAVKPDWTVGPQAARFRSCDLERAFCGHLGGRDRAADLFFGGVLHPTGIPAVRRT